MANYRLNLTNGPTTIDLYNGSYTKLLEAGLLMPVPRAEVARISSPFADGDRLASARYANRIITLNLKLAGSSLSNLRTNIRTIQRLLNDAAEMAKGAYTKKYLNLLTNPSFEAGDPPTGWTATRVTLARESTIVKHGTYSIKITANDAGVNEKFAYQNYAGYSAYAGLPVTLGAWCYCPAANDKNAQINLNDGVSLTNSSTLSRDGAWHWVSVTKTLDAAATQLWTTLRVVTNAGDTDDILYVDGAILTPGSYAPPTGTPLSSGKLFLEIQWGDQDGQSVYFEIVRGDLKTPDDFYSTNLSRNYMIIPARLELETKPLGEFMQVDLAQDMLENVDSGSSHNYKDITTTESYGDVPAKLFLKIASSGATGDKTMWVARRSGQRYNDDLWVEGESENSTATVTQVGSRAILTDVSSTHDSLVYSTLLTAQTFTPGANMTCCGAKVRISRVGTLTGMTLTASIKTTNVGHPTGTTLASGSVDVSSLSTSDTWVEITFYSSAALSSGTVYALVLALSAGDASNCVNCRTSSANPYAGGNFEYFNGSSWTSYLAYDVAGFMIMQLADSTGSDVADANASGGNFRRLATVHDATISADTIVGYHQYDLSPAPRGAFRVLARVKGSTSAGSYTSLSFGAGYAYGTVSDVPSNADGDFIALDAGSDTYQILDLGLINIPPIGESEIALNNTFSLRIYEYVNTAITPSGITQNTVNFDLDYIFLLPVDEGCVIINSVGTSDVLAIDSVSETPGVYVLDTSDTITEYPDYVGSPFYLGRDNTRIYILRDDAITATFAVDVKYVPRFLTV